ncbi:MAG: type I secretion system permease/ATPase [Desulfovibrionaceae bacterium]
MLVSPKSIDFEPPLLSCLSMLFRLLGNAQTVDTLKAGLPQSEEGITPARCIRTARLHGMRANLVRKQLVKNISPLTMPCILILNGNNACVLTAVTGDKATILLPETPGAPTQVDLEQLQSDYTGLVFFGQLEAQMDKRAADLRLVDTKPWFWGTIFHFLPIYKHVFIASIVINLLIIATPLFVMNVYDRVVPNNAVDTLWVLAIGVVLIYAFDFLLRNLRSYFLDVAGRNADVIIASRLLRQVMAMRFDHKPESTGTLANNLREFESLREFFSSTTFQAIIDFPFLILFIVIIWLIGGPLAWVPTIMVPLVLLFGVLIQYPLQRVVQKGYREANQKNALLIEIINGLETIKTSAAEGRMQHLWEKVVGVNSQTNKHSKTLANLSITLSVLSTQLVSVLIIIWGVYRISDGELTMGGLIGCNILAGRAMAPLGAVAAMLTRLQQSKMALKSLDLLMGVPTERPAEGTAFDYSYLEPNIVFENVQFSYPGAERPALENVSFRIRKGEKVGIIGQMGSGKSTLGKLMVGLYDPQEGAVKVGDVDIRQIDVANLRRNVGYVSQDNFLFYGSIKENIAIGLPNIDDHSILRAATISGAMDFIIRHPSGFALPVGERGLALSGGQRQSVAIARALLHDPDILIMDEPSSNMDQGAENKLKKRLKTVLKDKTVVIITHRMSMLDLVDKLILLDAGKVLAFGSKLSVLAALKEGHLKPGA